MEGLRGGFQSGALTLKCMRRPRWWRLSDLIDELLVAYFFMRYKSTDVPVYIYIYICVHLCECARVFVSVYWIHINIIWTNSPHVSFMILIFRGRYTHMCLYSYIYRYIIIYIYILACVNRAIAFSTLRCFVLIDQYFTPNWLWDHLRTNRRIIPSYCRTSIAVSTLCCFVSIERYSTPHW